MLVSGLAFAAFTASTTLATPLLGSLKGSNSDVDLQKRPSPRFNRRDVNKAELAQLPTCRRDDLYELFTEPLNEPYVEEFCSIYIASSSLVRATYVPTYTSAVYVTAAPQITTTTDVPSASATFSPSSAAAANSTSVIASAGCTVQNTTVTVTVNASSPIATGAVFAPRVKRQLLTAPAGGDQYPDLRLSSVCSCIVEPSTIVTTLTETGSAVFVTQTYTVQPTGGIPQTGNTTANITMTVPPFPNNTADATISLDGTAPGTASATGTISFSSNFTVFPTGTISSAPNATGNATATVSQSQNSTTTGFPGPTGTGAPSDRAAYCEQAFVRGNGTFQARYTVACGYSYANLAPARVESQSSWGDCLTDCDDDPRCYGFSYLLTSDEENCFIYNFYPLPAGQPDESFNSGTYVVGSNNGLQRRDI